MPSLKACPESAESAIKAYLKEDFIMSDREKLIQYITNLTDEEAEAFIAFLKTVPPLEKEAESSETLQPLKEGQGTPCKELSL